MTTPFPMRCAVLLACVTTLMGCGKPARDAVAALASPTSVQQPVDLLTTGDGIDRLDQMPLAKFLNGGLDAAAEGVAIVDLIEHCLRDAGYATLQLDRVRAATHTPERERRAQVGYGGAGVGDERSLPGQRWPEQIAAYASSLGESGAKFVVVTTSG